jgi:DNA-binding transcriptional ArsR family regulator
MTPGDADLAALGSVLGERARARMLLALGDGRALPAGVLASEAGVAASTASQHLGRLVDAGLLAVVPQGRHRYYRLAGPQVGQMLEGIMNVALNAPPRYQPKSRVDEQMRHARTCYDHIAGVLGVGLADAMTARELVVLGDEAGEVTPAGLEFLGKLGVDLSAAQSKRRVFCRPCLDWTERRPHIGGAVGAALAQRCLDLRWVARVRDHRALTITPAGRRGFQEFFALSV